MKFRASTFWIGLILLLPLSGAAAPAEDPATRLGTYREDASRIIQAALEDHGAWKKLEYLCDRIGNRLSGSRNLEAAIDWAAAEMKRDGLENVRILPVKVPHWVRGEEWGKIVAPIGRPLHLLGLGGSVATPPEGIKAELVVVSSFEELEQLGRSAVSGKIVLYNVAWEGYGPTVRYRGAGASRAASLGAVASLVRSVTPVSLQSPHTGALNYSDDAPKIPSAAVTIEDALLLQRLYASGDPVTVHLYMEGRTLPEADSANVIAEIPGREFPEQVVVMGGHIDSWDVGQGAHDDGGGVVASMQAAALLRSLGLQPRRTLRVVLFTNEENGLRGGRAYREWAGDEVRHHVAAIEMDAGAERPIGFGLGIYREGAEQEPALERAYRRAEEIAALLEPIGASALTRGGGGADIGPLMRAGVPGLGLRTVGERYFEWHHTESDTVDKIDPENLRKAVAALAIMGYVLADAPETLLD